MFLSLRSGYLHIITCRRRVKHQNNWMGQVGTHTDKSGAVGTAGRAVERSERAVKTACLHAIHINTYDTQWLTAAIWWKIREAQHTHSEFRPSSRSDHNQQGDKTTSLQTEFQPSRTIIKRVREENTRFNVNSPKIHRIFF